MWDCEGVGAENDAGGGADFDQGANNGAGGIVFRFWFSDDDGKHVACPSVATDKADWIDILDAAEVSLVNLLSYLQQHHSGMHTWYTAQTQQRQAWMRLAALAGRGL